MLLLLIFVLALSLSTCVAVEKSLSGPTLSPMALPSLSTENLTAPTTAIGPTYTPEASSTIVSMLSPKQALELMYGEEALSISDREAHLRAPVEGYTTTVHINLMACYWEDDIEKCLVITDGAFDSSHVSQADIAGAVFYRIDSRWRLNVFQPHIISLGSFGYVPKGELIQIGPERYAVLLRSGWAGQGYQGEYATILAETEDTLRVVFHLRVNESQDVFDKGGSATMAWGYASNLEFVAGENPDYYDLVITQYGINPEGKNFKTVKAYTFSNMEYVLFD